MSPFYAVCNSAKQGNLALHPRAGYLASDAFRKRIEFEGDAGRDDKVRVSLHMLKSCALDHRHSDRVLDNVKKGFIYLNFFGVSNPVTMFDIPPGEMRAALVAAVEENLSSRMYEVSKRVSKWRGRVTERGRHEDAVRDRFRQQQAWPTAADFKADRDAAQKQQDAMCVQINAHMDAVRSLRNTRLAKLANGAQPGVKSWTDFLVDIALSALPPY